MDINCADRVLLQSVKPALHANIDCTPLVAAVVSRQVSMVKYLLEVMICYLILNTLFISNADANYHPDALKQPNVLSPTNVMKKFHLIHMRTTYMFLLWSAGFIFQVFLFLTLSMIKICCLISIYFQN